MLNSILEWHQQTWVQLIRMVHDNRLPHALLLTGDHGIGKLEFANELASSLLCNQFHKTGQRCLCCQSCLLTEAATHPDFLKVTSEPGHAIKVDQIREVTDFVNQTPLLGGYRVILINPASAMNMSAANALLKTLEEPTPNVLLILISDQSLNLPATILSRCQKIVLKKPNQESGLKWLRKNISDTEIDLSLLLNLCQGAPLAAKEFYEQGAYTFRQELYLALQALFEKKADVVDLSQQWQEKSLLLFLQLMLSWLNDLVRIKTIAKADIVINKDHQDFILQVTQKIATHSLLEYLDYLKKIYKYILMGHNLNQRLLIEDVLIKLARCRVD